MHWSSTHRGQVTDAKEPLRLCQRDTSSRLASPRPAFPRMRLAPLNVAIAAVAAVALACTLAGAAKTSTLQPSAPPAPCVIRLGTVSQLSGNLSNTASSSAYQTAIAKINQGVWASGQRAPGISLGKGLPYCTFELISSDDQSNSTLHTELVANLIPQVDIFLIGSPVRAFAFDTAQQVVDAGMLGISCCLPSNQAFSYKPSQSFLFGMARPVDSITAQLLHYLNLSPTKAHIGIVYSSTEQANVDMCTGVLNYTAALPVVTMLSARTGDGTLPLLSSKIRDSGVTFLFVCLELDDSLQMASLVSDLQLEGAFFSIAPAYSVFTAISGTLYTFTGSQWNPALPFYDDFLGNSGNFAREMREFAGYNTTPNDIACAAAVSIELLAQALSRAAQSQTSHNVTQVLTNIKTNVASELLAFNNVTLFGPVQFNSLRRNVAGATMISQLLPNISGVPESLALVLPSDYSTALPVFPAPRLCRIRLGLVDDLPNSEAYLGYQVAINRLNSGNWANGGGGSGSGTYAQNGFSLGINLNNCQYELVAESDLGNLTLHNELVAQLSPNVEFMLSGAHIPDFYNSDAELLQQSLGLAVLCCNPELSVNESASVWSMYRPIESAASSLAVFLAAQINVLVAVVVSTTESANLAQCEFLVNYTSSIGGQGLDIAFYREVQTRSGSSINSSMAQQIVESGANVVVGCLEIADAIVLANTLADIPQAAFYAIYFTNGPGEEAFESAVKSSDFMLVSSQWIPKTYYDDQLLGDSVQFTADLGALDPGLVPSSVSVAAAVSVEVLHLALVQGMSFASTTSVVQGIKIFKKSIAAALQQNSLDTLLGRVAFAPDHSNTGSVLISQLQPQPPNYTQFDLVPVLPSNADFGIVYPIPSAIQQKCVVTLGLVYSATGEFAQNNAWLGYSLAIQLVNSGKWAKGSQAPGFNLGHGVRGCTYSLMARDDQSDPSLHLQLAQGLASSVDFMLSGERGNQSVDIDLAVAKQTDSFMLLVEKPALYFDEPGNFTFGLAKRVDAALQEFVRFLSFAYPRPTLAIVTTLTWTAAQIACFGAMAYATQFGLVVVSNHTMQSYDGSLPEYVANDLSQASASVLLMCLEDLDAVELVNLATPLGMTGMYTLAGPRDPIFDLRVSNEAFLFKTSQWSSSLPFTDDLFGNSTMFQQSLSALGASGSPRSTTCLAAVALELLTVALVDASSQLYVPKKQDVLTRAFRGTLRDNMQKRVAHTLMGFVQFDKYLQNIGDVVYTTQVNPSVGGLAVVFPSASASADVIYPAPTYDYCVHLLGLPTTLNYNNSQVSAQVVAECSAWESSTRLSTNSGGAFSGSNQTVERVCSTCNELFNISECYIASGGNPVRNVTLYPYFRPSTCGQDTAQATCKALLGNQSQILVVSCDYTPWNSAAGIFAAVFLCLCFCINVGFGACVVKHRNAKAIKFAQTYLLMGFIVGACLVSAFGLVFVGPATNAACQLRTWLFNFSVTVCLCPLFLKAYRVWRIFENPKLKHLVITNVMLFKALCAVLLVEVLWLAIWTGVSPTVRTCAPVYFPQLLTPIPSYICANTMSWFAIIAAIFIGLYVVSCVVLGLLTLNISTVFAEKEVLFASINIAIVGGIVAFLFFFTDLGIQATTALVAVGLGWCSTFSVGVLVAPKLYWILKKGEDYTNALAFDKTTSHPSEEIKALKDRTGKLNDENQKLKDEIAMLRLKLKQKGIVVSPDAESSSNRPLSSRATQPSATEPAAYAGGSQSQMDLVGGIGSQLDLVGGSASQVDLGVVSKASSSAENKSVTLV